MAKVTTSQRLRLLFCDFFTKKCGHEFVEPCSLLRPHDSTLEFTNAGMNQFKGIFLDRSLQDQADLPEGLDKFVNLKRACNYQKCIRVGGKLCDLDLVGRDFRHHTFFEMLGNWSFDDYYKEKACVYAFDFLFNELRLNKRNIFVTYHDNDIECRDLWIKLGLPFGRVLSNNTGDNFWEMGPTGPCGMSTEIFYIDENTNSQQKKEEPLEIWNLVFINQERCQDGSLKPLKKKFIDTGMGLERITSVIEGQQSNYNTDLFLPLFEIIARKSHLREYSGKLDDPIDIGYRILADHVRMITMSISDGLKPGRRGAANKLRKIIQRSLNLSREQFNQVQNSRLLLFDLVDCVIQSLKCAYPEINEKQNIQNIRRTIMFEEISQVKNDSTRNNS